MAELCLSLAGVAAALGATTADMRAVRRVTRPVLTPTNRRIDNTNLPQVFPLREVIAWVGALGRLDADTELALRRSASAQARPVAAPQGIAQ